MEQQQDRKRKDVQRDLDIENQDQPRSSEEELPKAHKEKEMGRKNPEGLPTRDRETDAA